MARVAQHAGVETRSANVGAAYLAAQRFVPRRWLSELFPDLPSWPAESALFRFDGGGLDDLAQWVRWNEFSGHLTRVLLKVDRASMHHSLEVRVPLLDREVLAISARVDWRSCLDLRSLTGKMPLRAALARQVRFQTRAKRGFTVAMGEWLRGPLRPILEEVVMPRTEILGMPIRRKALRAQLQRHIDRDADFKWGLWRLLSLCLWEERHYKR